MLIVVIKLNTVSNSRKSSIQALHTDLKRSTTQYPFKSISAGLTRHTKETKNKEKTVTARTLLCLLLIYLVFSFPPGSCERHAQMAVTKFGCALGATVVFFVDSVQILRAIR